MLLPFVPLSLKCLRPKEYSENPKTLRQHLLKRRLEARMSQKQVAAKLGVNQFTYLLWEKDRIVPVVRQYPPIFRFLGYSPFEPPCDLAGRLKTKRKQLGISIRRAAALACVDAETFRRWEAGERRSRVSEAAVVRFLAFEEDHH